MLSENTVEEPQDAFSQGIIACYNMGKRMRQSPIFIERYVRKYKRRARDEALRIARQKKSITNANGTAPASSSIAATSASAQSQSAGSSTTAASSPSTANGSASNIPSVAAAASATTPTASNATKPKLSSAPPRIPESDYVDCTQVKCDLGSSLDEFYNKWPRTCRLESGDPTVEWAITLETMHCHFCKPRGKCESLKELIDHLNTHHPQFLYRPRCAGNIAVISMKVNEKRDTSTDQMFIALTVCYMLSPKLRRKCPQYCTLRKAPSPTFPFFSERKIKEDDDWGFIAGAPGTRAANNKAPRRAITSADGRKVQLPKVKHSERTPNVKRSSSKAGRKRSASKSSSKPSSSRTSKSRQAESGSGSRSVSEANGRTNRRDSRRRSRTNPKGLGITFSESSDSDSYSGPSRGNGSSRKGKPMKSSTANSTSTKRRLRNDPVGMENVHTAHLRKVIFGEDKAHSINVGSDNMPPMTQEAAHGRLFHTVTNAPLDTDKYNAGLDSDRDEECREAWWRLQLADEQLDEMVDMHAIEKYFFGMWNQFIQMEFGECNDRNVNKALFKFIKKYGGEVKRMKLEAIFAHFLKQCWADATLDTDSVTELFKALGERAADAKSGTPHPDLVMAQRWLYEASDPFKNQFKYTGLTNRSVDVDRVDQSVADWLLEESEAVDNVEIEISPNFQGLEEN